jgi:DNA mismatch repair ATPase MutS
MVSSEPVGSCSTDFGIRKARCIGLPTIAIKVTGEKERERERENERANEKQRERSRMSQRDKERGRKRGKVQEKER